MTILSKLIAYAATVDGGGGGGEGGGGQYKCGALLRRHRGVQRSQLYLYCSATPQCQNRGRVDKKSPRLTLVGSQVKQQQQAESTDGRTPLRMELQIGANHTAPLLLQNGASLLNAFSEMAEPEGGREEGEEKASQREEERKKERKILRISVCFFKLFFELQKELRRIQNENLSKPVR